MEIGTLVALGLLASPVSVEPGSTVPWKDGQRPTEDITLVAHGKMENTMLVQDVFPEINNAADYLAEKYDESYGWEMTSSDFTSDHSRGIPVEIGSELYYGDSQPMSNFGIAFDESSTTFKIEVKVANPEGDRNKGRVCIGDIVAFYE